MKFRRTMASLAIGSALIGTSVAGASPATAAQPPGQDSAMAAAVNNYTILVRTADIPNAGTDATIRMKVYGTLRESPGYVNLDNAADNFERNTNDVFGPFHWFDIGRPDFIGVYKGSNGSEWYPEYASIYSESTGLWYHCQMDAYYGDGEETQWFDCP